MLACRELLILPAGEEGSATSPPPHAMADWRETLSLNLFLIFTYWSQAIHYWILKRHSSIGKGIFHLKKHRQNVIIWVTWQPSFYFYFLVNVMHFSSSIFTPRFMKLYVIVCSLVLGSLSYFFLKSGLPCMQFLWSICWNNLRKKLKHVHGKRTRINNAGRGISDRAVYALTSEEGS